MTLEHKYYSFDEMPEGYEFIRLMDASKYRKVKGKLEHYVVAKAEWSNTRINGQLPKFIPIPPEPKIYEKYLNGKRELVIKGLNGHVTLKVTFVQSAHGYKQTIKEAIPAINAFLEDICGEGL